MQQQPQQVFTISDLSGADIEAIMNSLNEQPSKIGRVTMNKIEAQVVQQVIAAQQPPQDGKKSDGDKKPE